MSSWLKVVKKLSAILTEGIQTEVEVPVSVQSKKLAVMVARAKSNDGEIKLGFNSNEKDGVKGTFTFNISSVFSDAKLQNGTSQPVSLQVTSLIRTSMHIF